MELVEEHDDEGALGDDFKALSHAPRQLAVGGARGVGKSAQKDGGQVVVGAADELQERLDLALEALAEGLVELEDDAAADGRVVLVVLEQMQTQPQQRLRMRPQRVVGGQAIHDFKKNLRVERGVGDGARPGAFCILGLGPRECHCRRGL